MGGRKARRLRSLTQAQAVDLYVLRAMGFRALVPEEEEALAEYEARPEILPPEPESPKVCSERGLLVEVGPRFVMGRVTGQGIYEHDGYSGKWTIVGVSGDGLDWLLVRGAQPEADRSDGEVFISRSRCTIVG